jgi:hypothetical protein
MIIPTSRGDLCFGRVCLKKGCSDKKKIVRQVIETGLQRDFESSILDIDQIIQQWKSKKKIRSAGSKG